MHTRIIALALALLLGLTLGGCSSEATPEADEPGVQTPADAGDEAADGAGDDVAGGIDTGTRPANGLYDQGDGTVIALGTLEWVDLEGGFYALTGSPEGEGNIVVIANAGEFADQLEALTGSDVIVTGTVVEGVSIRMAGPEVAIDSIGDIGAAGAAE